MISYIFKIDFDVFRFTVVAVTGFINLRLLYNVSKPLTIFRKLLVIICFVVFYILLIAFHNILLINKFNFLSMIFMALLIYSSIYLIDFLENLYDLTVNYFKNKRRGGVINEK